MALAVISAEGALDTRRALHDLQLEQFNHDEKYHREIARLSVQDRLRHMALHFAKYAGNLAEAQGDWAKIQRVVTDVFIIGTSCANTLNVRLPDVLPPPHSAEDDGDVNSFATVLTINAGRMAAACERLDHLEDFPFRPTIRDAAVALIDQAIRFAEAQGWDLPALARARLARVKEKMIFHGRV
jgi:hypothetical protein